MKRRRGAYWPVIPPAPPSKKIAITPKPQLENKVPIPEEQVKFELKEFSTGSTQSVPNTPPPPIPPAPPSRKLVGFRNLIETACAVAIGSAIGNVVGSGLAEISHYLFETKSLSPNTSSGIIDPCASQLKKFLKCAQNNTENISACKELNEMLQNCRQLNEK